MRQKPRTLAWLESEGATAEDRLLALRRWIVRKLRPVMAPPAAVTRPFEEPEEDKEEEEDKRPGANSKTHNRERFQGWRLQVAALRLTSALVVLCTNSHAHLLLDEPGLKERKTRKAAKQRLSSESDLSLLEVVHRVLINTPAGEASDGSASHLRREAMRTLAVVSMVLEDTRLGLEACGRLARLYLVEWPEPATVDRRLWDTADTADNSDEESDDTGNQSDDDKCDIDDGEEEDEEENDEHGDENEDEDDDDDDDHKEGDEDEVGGRDAAPWRGPRHSFRAERAEALSTIAFLLSLVDADAQVMAFIARHKESLISTLCAKSEREHMAGPSTHFLSTSL